jgi:hypothetical protein
MNRNLRSRIRAVKMARKGTGDNFFVVWGCNTRAIEAAISAARRAGTIMPDDMAVRGVWLKDAPGEPPTARWASFEEVSDAEVELLASQVGVFPDAPSQLGNDKAKNYTDTDLFGITFGQRVVA